MNVETVKCENSCGTGTIIQSLVRLPDAHSPNSCVATSQTDLQAIQWVRDVSGVRKQLRIKIGKTEILKFLIWNF